MNLSIFGNVNKNLKKLNKDIFQSVKIEMFYTFHKNSYEKARKLL